MFDLSGLRALITGASGGIGGAAARALHAQGASVVLHGTRREALEALANELGERTSIFTARLDVEAEADALWASAGAPDILVNNAGITRDGLLMRMKDADLDAVLNVNLRSAMRLCREAVRDMMKKRFGRIINVGSVVAQTGNAGQTAYCAAKAGLVGFSKALAQETASRGITVNVLAPGFIVTPMTEALSEAHREAIAKNIPTARLGTPNDCAAAVVYLASREAAYVTGQTLHVNGGLAMV